MSERATQGSAEQRSGENHDQDWYEEEAERLRGLDDAAFEESLTEAEEEFPPEDRERVEGINFTELSDAYSDIDEHLEGEEFSRGLEALGLDAEACEDIKTMARNNLAKKVATEMFPPEPHDDDGHDVNRVMRERAEQLLRTDPDEFADFEDRWGQYDVVGIVQSFREQHPDQVGPDKDDEQGEDEPDELSAVDQIIALLQMANDEVDRASNPELAALLRKLEDAVNPRSWRDKFSDFKNRVVGAVRERALYAYAITTETIRQNVYRLTNREEENLASPDVSVERRSRVRRVVGQAAIAVVAVAAAGGTAYAIHKGLTGGSDLIPTDGQSGMPGRGSGGGGIENVANHMTFSREARLAAPGEGWLSTIAQATGVDDPKRQQSILRELAPHVLRTGEAYRLDDMRGSLGITKPGQLSTKTLELIHKIAERKGYIKG